jgi:3',5'-cyclic AMP phosphodiesterase CpdA
VSRLFAVSDLHVGSPENRQAVAEIPRHPDDHLIVAGDVGERFDDVRWALDWLRGRFRGLVWVPGNHELWSLPGDPQGARGEERYLELVEMCRRLDVLTPEDPYPLWRAGPGEEAVVLAPLFLLYDYSFRPPALSKEEALARAARSGVVCADELLLHPDPHASREAWCRARIEISARRLEAVPERYRLVAISHFPLRQDLVFLPRVPLFSPWCGTRATEDWHRRFRAKVVVSGHLHLPGTSWRDGVRFEEVSFGYPRDWARTRSNGLRLREVLPADGVHEPGPGEDEPLGRRANPLPE